MPKSSPGHCGHSGTCWTHLKGQVRHLGLLGSYFQGPLPFSPSLSPRTNLKPQRLREIHRQVKNAQTARSQTTGGKFSPQLESVCAQRPRWTYSGEDSPWSKLAFGTLAQKPLWREWCRGKVSVLISKWELMGGEGKHHSWVAYLDLWGFSKARFTQTTLPLSKWLQNTFCTKATLVLGGSEFKEVKVLQWQERANWPGRDRVTSTVCGLGGTSNQVCVYQQLYN